jgi:hypothetical protein
MKDLSRALILFVVAGLVFGCGPKKEGAKITNPIESFAAPTHVVVNENPQINKYTIRKIAVLPFGYKRFARVSNRDRDINEILTRMFIKELITNSTYQIMPREEINKLLSAYNIDSFNKEKFANGLSLLKNKGIDGVVMGEVSRYRERKGSAFSAKSPGSVAFQIYFFNVEDGASLWSASFDKTQKALSENALEVGSFLKGGGTWQTSETIARLGIEEVVRQFPRLNTPSIK